MNFWPFRQKAVPADGVSRWIGNGIYEFSLWIVLGVRFEGTNNITVNNCVFTTEAEAREAADRWTKTGDYDRVWYRHGGTSQVDVGFDSLLRRIEDGLRSKGYVVE